MHEYDDPAFEYCQKVLSGKIIACNKIKQMAKRHLEDLKRQDDEDFPYYWDVDIAKKADTFIQYIPDVDAGKPIPLALFQRAIFVMIMAWRSDSGGRRWTNVVLSMSRTNSKTQIASWIAVYDFLYGVPLNNRQILCCAISKDLSDRLLTYCKSILRNISKINSTVDKAVDIKEHEIVIKSSSTFMKKISEDTKGIDTYHATLAVNDEVHLQKTRDFSKKITSGMVNNDDALYIQTSTAGIDTKVPMYKDYQGLWKNILDGKVKMDTFLVIIYEQDNADKEMYDESTWIKSNPLMEIPSVKKKLTKGIIQERDIAIQQETVSQFQNKNMNVWKSLSDRSLISNVEDWNKATLPNFDVNSRDVYIGLDLGKTNDNSSAAFIFPYLDDARNQKWHIMQHSFIGIPSGLGIEGKEKKDGIMYRNLERKGECSITKLASGYVDYDFVFQYICDFVDEHNLNVISVNYDKYAIANIINKIENDPEHDWEVVSVGTSFRDLKDPTNQFLMLFGNGQITHDDSEMLNAAFSNAVLLENDHGMKIDKYNDKAGFRIDPADATINTFVNAGFYFNENHDSSILPISGKTNEELNNFFQSSNFSF
jgi:phage terminase large subunit-like protein